MTPDEIKKLSDSELLVVVNLYNKIGEDYDLAVREHCRRQELKEKENKAQMSTSVHWSKIAGIAAILASIFAFAQLVISYRESNNLKTNTSQQIQQPAQNIQQSTKNRDNLSSSLSDSTIAPSSNDKKGGNHAN